MSFLRREQGRKLGICKREGERLALEPGARRLFIPKSKQDEVAKYFYLGVNGSEEIIPVAERIYPDLDILISCWYVLPGHPRFAELVAQYSTKEMKDLWISECAGTHLGQVAIEKAKKLGYVSQ